MSKEAVTVRQQRPMRKLVRQMFAEKGLAEAPRLWEVRHWGKHVHLAFTEEAANEWAERLRQRLDRDKFDKEQKRIERGIIPGWMKRARQRHTACLTTYHADGTSTKRSVEILNPGAPMGKQVYLPDGLSFEEQEAWRFAYEGFEETQ